MKNPFTARSWNFGKILLVLWMIFSVVFVLVTLWTNVIRRTYDYGVQNGMQNGVQMAVSDIITKATSKCEPLPLFVGSGENRKEVGLINIACLQDPNAKKTEESSE